MRRLVHRLKLFVIASVAVVAVSCIGPRERRLPESGATLEGTVTYNGQQLEFAMIHVVTKSNSAQGMIGEDGKYKVSNVPLGDVKVGVNTSAARGAYQSKIMAQNPAAADPAKSKRITSAPKFVDVPQKYFDPETSGLTTAINKGVNTFNITIK